MAGWHDAGLVLSAADQSAGGVQWLSTVGNRIIASTASGKVFLGQQGSSRWDTLPFPVGDSVYSQTAIDSSVYFGTRSTGQVWRLTFPEAVWTNLGSGIGQGFGVDGLGFLKGALVLFAGALRYPDSTTFVKSYSGTVGSWMDLGKGWPRPDWSTGAVLEASGKLFSSTYQTGLWRRSATDTAWSKIPDPIYLETFANDSVAQIPMDKPRCLAWYHGNLWMGNLYYGQIFHMTGTDTPWVSVGMDSIASGMSQFPLSFQAMTMIVWKDRLFAGGGRPSIPAVLKEGSGWQFLFSNWGKSDDGGRNACSVDLTLSFAAIGDTLYAAGCGHIFKLPWSQVPQ